MNKINDGSTKQFTEAQLKKVIESYNAQSLSKVKEALAHIKEESQNIKGPDYAKINAHRAPLGSTISIKVGYDENYDEKISIRRR